MSVEQMSAMHERACQKLHVRGFNALGWMRFEKGGRIYDLSAADLNQIDRIEAEGLFLVR